MTDVFDARFARNPWPTLERLRTAGDGIHRVRTPDGPPAWLVTRYHDVRAGLLDRRLSTQARYAKGDDYRASRCRHRWTRCSRPLRPTTHACAVW
ncbi:hypothetical protein ABZ552_28275 [Nocardia sp. NPDC019219]|uniref:hypothetical protein n=1 Tax=Nocardia sp. NPDC019219 TaxID=3154590 RepID=UPI0033EBDEB0